ncbi:unnamed protein product [Pseudo-nitzschia multistriata]|uniref:Srp40 C-terminal domain-containing protein n=1 Tax=Pseudo-nitzschia multistriata TaxID=183589 RepID=A0A448ZEX5_9STRA|nr:unnamed protein product [Pseudo-nitzschia multistriata]
MLSSKSSNCPSPLRTFKKKNGLGLYGAIYQSAATSDLESHDDGSDDNSLEGIGSEDDPLLESLRRNLSLETNSNLAVPVLEKDDDDDEEEDDKHADRKSVHSALVGGASRSATTSLADAMADPDQVGTASVASEVMSITKNILGAGVLSLSEGIATYSNDPNAMISAVGWVVLLGGMFGYFCVLIAKICKMTRSATYRECWESTMGDRGGLAVSIVSALLPAQGNLSATTVLSQTLQSLLETFHIYWSRVTCLLLLTVFILLPMCLVKDLDSISTYSTIGVVSIGVAAISMVIRYYDESYQLGGMYYDETKIEFRPSFGHETLWNATVLPFVCMVFNSYIMHYNSPRFYMELKERSIPRYALSVGLSFGLASIILILIAGSGYLTFGKNSSSYILNNYSPNDPLATASRIVNEEEVTYQLSQILYLTKTMPAADETSKDMALAILKQLQELDFAKSSKALEKEILKRFSLKSLPAVLSDKVLSLQPIKTPEVDDDDSSTSSDSSSGSSSSSSDEEETKPAVKKSKESVSITETKKKVDSDSSDSDSDSDSSSSSSDSDSSSSESEDDEPPKKRTKTTDVTKSKKESEIVTPVESSDSDSDSDVSDVDVSSVSSVSSDDDSDSDSDSSSSSSSSSSDSSSDSESEDEDLEAFQKAKRKKAAEKAKQAAEAALAWTPKKIKKDKEIKVEAGTDGAQALSAGKPFQRVDDSYWGDMATKDGGAMADNSYEGVFGNDGFGARSSEKLLQVRGKRFQHEKTKRKRSFNGMSRTGGKIDMASNSTKYKYDD